LIRRPIRRQRNRRGFLQRSPSMQLDATFQLTDFENPTEDDLTRVRLVFDQQVIASDVPDDIQVQEAADPTQTLDCLGFTQLDGVTIDLFFGPTFDDGNDVTTEDLLFVPFSEDDIRTMSAGYIDASSRVMTPAEPVVLLAGRAPRVRSSPAAPVGRLPVARASQPTRAPVVVGARRRRGG